MIVVSDTTPLISLLKVGHLDLLDKYFGDAGLTTAGSNKQTITIQTQEPAINKSDNSLLAGLGGLFSVSSSPVDETPDNPDLRKKKKKKRQLKL